MALALVRLGLLAVVLVGAADLDKVRDKKVVTGVLGWVAAKILLHHLRTAVAMPAEGGGDMALERQAEALQALWESRAIWSMRTVSRETGDQRRVWAPEEGGTLAHP